MIDPDAPTTLFESDGASTYRPTTAAAGPWRPDALHGGAVSALLAGRLELADHVMIRILLDLLRPVPMARLELRLEAAEGGRSVVRRSAVLEADGRPVARASALLIRRADIELPDGAADHPTAFDPDAAPDLSQPNLRAAKVVGRPSFDSVALAVHVDPPSSNGRNRMWNHVLLPIVDDIPTTPVEQVAAACDNASGVARRLPFQEWSFMNADLVISLARPPVGDWIALESEGYVADTGTGLAVSTIHDAAGVLGQKSSSVLIAPRR